MKIILNRTQARHILEWCDCSIEAERDHAQRYLNDNEPKEARKYFQRAKTWVQFKTQLKEGMKRESPKRKSKANPNS